MIKKFICKLIWDITGKLDIPLGKLAPHILGGMIGSKPIKINKD